MEKLAEFCSQIKPGMSHQQIDTLLEFRVAGMHQGGGRWRSIFNNIYQHKADYQDSKWESHSLRFLFAQNKLIYFDLAVDQEQKVVLIKMDTLALQGQIDAYNRQYGGDDSLASILASFYTTVENLDKPLSDWFVNAPCSDKEKLFSYARSLNPEYSGSAIIRLLELEKEHEFLNASEKEKLKQLIDSETTIAFFIGCIYRETTMVLYLEEYRPELKDVIR